MIKKGSIFAGLISCAFFIQTAQGNFSDITNEHLNYDAINYAESQKIVEGYSNGTYRPNKTINRAEFAKIIIESSFQKNVIDSCITQNIQNSWNYVFFSDVSKETWFAKYICIAKLNNIIGGYPDGTFKPSQDIAFTEAAKIIVNTFKYQLKIIDIYAGNWYAPYVLNLSEKRAIPTTITGLDKKITRGEMAEIIYRLKEKIVSKSSMVFENFSLIPTDPVLSCPPKFNPISNNKYYDEKIVFALNEDAAINYPGWKDKAKLIVDDINAIFTKTTKKHYTIELFKTYSSDYYSNLLKDKNYYLNNENYGGTTLFFYLSTQPDYAVPDNVLKTQLVNVANYQDIDGVKFNSVWIAPGAGGDLFKGKEALNKKWGDRAYASEIATITHELGHTLGLGYGEWYNNEFEDQTGELPNLGTYSFMNTVYPKDPMSGNLSTPDPQFADINSWIIDKNATHQYSFSEVAKFHSPKVLVRVKDINGNLISMADVKVFGAKKNCFYCNAFDMSKPLQTLKTNANGEVEIDNISPIFYTNEDNNTGWLAKIIKVSKGGLHGGSAFTLTDSQKSCIQEESEVHQIDIIIK